MRALGYAIVFLGLLALTCGGSSPTPEAAVDAAVTQTLAAYTQQAAITEMAQTLEAAMTQPTAIGQEAVPSSTPTEAATSTPLPPTDTAIPPSPTAAEFAPNPLPAAYTGVILSPAQCFDFDDGQVVPFSDSRRDVCLLEAGLLRQQNGAHVSGYVTQQPPSRTACLGARYEAGDLAIQTDLYYCFLTNEGRPGFIVPRQYLSETTFAGFVFDYWVFR